MDIKKEMCVEINKLYPTESIASIRPELINKIKERILPNGANTEIYIIEYNNYYYIVKGHHQLLAAAFAGANKVRTYLVDYHSLSFFSNSYNIESTLSSIGLATVYDFEGIGGFKYESYPEYYCSGGIQ